MTTNWKRLTRKDLTTFDTFATDAVLTAMQLGGIGSIATNGHAKIRGKNGGSMIIARDTSAPHCQGNVMKALRRTFPELKNDTPKKDSAMTSDNGTATTDTTAPEMLDCPAKGCELRFADAEILKAHINSDHVVCKWEGCDYGPDGGAFIGRSAQAVAGHVGIYHKENKPWLANREKAAVNRAASIKKKAAVKREADAPKAASNGHALTTIEEWADAAGASRVEESVPVAVPEQDATTKLALIREILGDDDEVAALKKQVADLTAHLALVREAVGLDFGPEGETDK